MERAAVVLPIEHTKEQEQEDAAQDHAEILNYEASVGGFWKKCEINNNMGKFSPNRHSPLIRLVLSIHFPNKAPKRSMEVESERP